MIKNPIILRYLIKENIYNLKKEDIFKNSEYSFIIKNHLYGIIINVRSYILSMIENIK